MHHKALWPVTKKQIANFVVIQSRRLRSTDRMITASKVTVGIVPSEGAEATDLERWVSDNKDVRDDSEITQAIVSFTEEHGVKTVVVADRIIGCPHEEGIDYPEGQKCPSVGSGPRANDGPAMFCIDLSRFSAQTQAVSHHVRDRRYE